MILLIETLLEDEQMKFVNKEHLKKELMLAVQGVLQSYRNGIGRSADSIDYEISIQEGKYQ